MQIHPCAYLWEKCRWWNKVHGSMSSKRVILTWLGSRATMVNYRVWVQPASLLCILLTIAFTIWLWTKTITFDMIRCDGHHWIELSKCVALGMWILISFVLKCKWIIWQLLNTKIHFDMSLFKEVDIDHESINLNQEIMCTCNIQHSLLWMCLWDVLFCGCEMFTFWGVVEGSKWSWNMEGPHA